jgi:hypothetical protein
MKTRDPLNPGNEAFDKFGEQVRRALLEEGVIIPETIEEVRQVKALLKKQPVTLPPHLRDSAAISNRATDEEAHKACAPEPTIAWNNKSQTNIGTGVRHKKGSVFFRRAAFDSYVVLALLDDENLGRTKIEKITHLTEFHCGIDFQREPLRDAAGPVDYISRRKVESLAKKQKWYSAVDAENRRGVKYVPGSSIRDALPIAERTMGSQRSAVDALIELLRPLNTRTCEIIATLYAAWNDLLLAGRTPSDDEILKEARENWHPKKLTIPLQQWVHGLQWMRNKHLVPRGTGRPVPRANT